MARLRDLGMTLPLRGEALIEALKASPRLTMRVWRLDGKTPDTVGMAEALRLVSTGRFAATEHRLRQLTEEIPAPSVLKDARDPRERLTQNRLHTQLSGGKFLAKERGAFRVAR